MPIPTVNGTIATASTSAAAASLTYSHTVNTGLTDPFLIVTVFDETTALPTGVTYATVAMTLLKDGKTGAVAIGTSIFGLANPTTGANNVVVSYAANHHIGSTAITLVDASATGQPDATAQGNKSPATTSHTVNIVTVANNCIVIDVCGTDTAAVNDHTPGVNETERSDFDQTSATQNRGSTDTEAAVTAGTFTMSRSFDSSSNSDSAVVSIKGTVVVAGGAPNMMMMGVGG